MLKLFFFSFNYLFINHSFCGQNQARICISACNKQPKRASAVDRGPWGVGVALLTHKAVTGLKTCRCAASAAAAVAVAVAVTVTEQLGYVFVWNASGACQLQLNTTTRQLTDLIQTPMPTQASKFICK